MSSLAHQVATFPAAGHVAVKERANAIALASADDFRCDSDRVGKGVKRGLQTPEAELAMGSLLADRPKTTDRSLHAAYVRCSNMPRGVGEGRRPVGSSASTS